MNKVFVGTPTYFHLTKQLSKTNRTPLYLMMNLETGCTYRCLKCALPGYRKDMGRFLTPKERKDILFKAKKSGVKALVIVGRGEPTEHFQDIIKPVIHAAHKLGLITILFTTANKLNRSQAEFYRDHDTSLFVSLDSLTQTTYQKLTGRDTLKQVLNNIKILRQVYLNTCKTIRGKKIVRLGLNVTVLKQNCREIDKIKSLAGDDMLFVANAPIRRGTFAKKSLWDQLVGRKYNRIKQIAKMESDTGSHSSVVDGVCGYFNRGISVDVDGVFLSCGYAAETAHALGKYDSDLSVNDYKNIYKQSRAAYNRFKKKTGRTPSCPLRDKDYQIFVRELDTSHRFNRP